MDYIIALILGIIQGLTEFLPVSSSGHLEIAKFILGDDDVGQQSMLMTVVLHFGTALATIIFFWKDIVTIVKGVFTKEDIDSKKFVGFIIISMIPAAVVGLGFEDKIEQLFTQNILLVCGMLIITAVLLYLADKAQNTVKKVGLKESIIIGVAQAIAILPGISRSGATIATSTLLGVDRSKAARFSFLMVVPLIFAKMAKDLIDGDFNAASSNTVSLLIGFCAALITGYFACKWMIELVKKAKLSYFAYYCLTVGIFGIVYVLIK